MKLIDADAIPWMVVGIGEIPVITKEEIEEMPTIDAVERIEYEKMKDLAEQYKFEYDCVFESLKEVLNEVLPNRVEVVRCKDCKWWELVDDYYAKGYGECTCPRSVIKRSSFLNEDWYCADGERKEE